MNFLLHFFLPATPITKQPFIQTGKLTESWPRSPGHPAGQEQGQEQKSVADQSPGAFLLPGLCFSEKVKASSSELREMDAI